LWFVATAFATESTIYPGIGIGKIKLGMTTRQVESHLGTTHLLNAHSGAYTEWAWDFASWTVGFEGGHVVQISTTLRAQHTSKGVGPGTPASSLVKAFPGGRCTHATSLGSTNSLGNPNFLAEYGTEYLVTHRGGGQTIFILHREKIETPATPFHYSDRQVVTDVYVRTAFRPLPEFASSWPSRGNPSDCAL
jgi:hypothetical protein